MIRKIFTTSIVLLLPTIVAAQNLELCKILEQHCKEIKIFSKQNKEDNDDIIALCEERVDTCKSNLEEVMDDASMEDFVDNSKDLEKLVEEIEAQVGETRDEALAE